MFVGKKLCLMLKNVDLGGYGVSFAKNLVEGLREREQEVAGPRAADIASKKAMVQWLKEEQHLVNCVSTIDDLLIDRFSDAYFRSIRLSFFYCDFPLFSVNHYCLHKRS